MSRRIEEYPMAIPKRVSERIVQTLKSFRPVLEGQLARDVSEADTVTLVKDIMADVFGYNKYSELTSEHAIRGTFCDLAVKIDSKLSFIIEVKAIGTDLRDIHVKQAVDYASNQGVEWVILTNAVEWHLYHVIFKKPIDKKLIVSFDLRTVDLKSEGDLDKLFLITREGFAKSAPADYRDRKEATSRFAIAAIVLHSEDVLNVIRREIRRMSELSVDHAEIQRMLREEVLKRDAIDGDEAGTALRRLQRSSSERSTRKKTDSSVVPAVTNSPTATVQTPPPC